MAGGPPFTPPTDPADCFGLSPFGFGPFPQPGQSVMFCPPHPDGSGYGGVGWAPNTLVVDPGGGPYGLSAYGSTAQAAPPMNISGGYGGDPYGLGPYGSIEFNAPRLLSAVSRGGWEIEVFFSEPMDDGNPALFNPASYTLTAVVGGPSMVSSVRVGTTGDPVGVLSVILSHTGTLLGGTYQLTASGPTDVSGNPILAAAVSLLTQGEAPIYSIVATSGEDLVLTFAQAMLPAAQEPVGNVHGILDVASYEFTSTPSYPVSLTPTTVEHPYGGDAAQIHMVVQGMTSLDYRCRISPAMAIGYDGSYLPSDATTFRGIELNPGNGTSMILGSRLLLSRPGQKAYGWTFEDTSGRVVPDTSTFRVDLTFDAGSATYNPPLGAYPFIEIGQWVVEDGPAASGVQVKITLQRAPGLVDQIRVQSGTYDVTLNEVWTTPGAKIISVIRNRKAGIYVVLLNGRPVISTAVANFNQPAQGSGANATWTFFGCPPDISGFQLLGVRYTATQTVFSGAWNFLHDEDSDFVGSALLAKDWLETARGPLVKDWGDATPATKQDVHVFVNSSEVEVREVNPYTGKVFLVVPVPLLPVGDPQSNVTVDYRWMATPIMAIQGLNTEGLVLNKWDRDVGRHSTTPPAGPGQWGSGILGAADTSRFPLAVVLGPVEREAPLYTSHRYMGFERGYSALLNSPTTMLLNQNPFNSAIPGFKVEPVSGTGVFVGTTDPQDDDPPWTVVGSGGHGTVNVGGTYTVTKDQSGDTFFYSRRVDLTSPTTVTMAARALIESVTNPEGVFTGVCFGFSSVQNLYLVGALKVNGLEHAGLLKDSGAIEDVAGWQVGPSASATVQTRTLLTIPTSQVPFSFAAGGRFQILSPQTQQGVYTAASVIRHSTGQTEITLAAGQSFPVDPHLYGNKYMTVLFEAVWSEGSVADLYTTYRLVVDTEQKTAQLWASGETTALVATLDGDAPEAGYYPLPGLTEGTGMVFWGCLSPEALSTSRWVFTRYGTVPKDALLQGHSLTVLTEMDDLPEDNPDYEWAVLDPFGYSFLASSGQQVVVKRTSASQFASTPFAYERIEGFFTPTANLDLQTKFQSDFGCASVVLNDGEREARLATLVYRNTATAHELVWPPSVSLSSHFPVEEQGWNVYLSQAEISVLGSDLVFTVTPDGQPGGGAGIQLDTEIDLSSYNAPDDNGRIMEVDLAVESYGSDSVGMTGIFFGGDVCPDRYIAVRLRGGATPGLQLIDLTGQVQQFYPFGWNDQQHHTYRLVASNGAASLFVDNADTPLLPTVSLATFSGNPGGTHFYFGAGLHQSVTHWRAVSYSLLPSLDARRTLGVLRAQNSEDDLIDGGADPASIDSWEIPRTDALDVPNSDLLAVIEEMDWRSPTEVRMLRTPDWGLTVYRPDLPPPPYYTPETPGVPGSGFINLTTEPSAGWINVEYTRLPAVQATFGSVVFGAHDPVQAPGWVYRPAVSQHRWDYVRYRLFVSPTEDFKQPQHMVLNYANVITSGEFSDDVSLETAEMTPYTAGYQDVGERTASTRYCFDLGSLHLYARDIYKVVDGSTIYTQESWSFDPLTQVIRFNRDLVLSGNAATILFYPGKPVTNTYLLNQPLLDGVTLLNEGTPPVPMSQTAECQKAVIRGSDLGIVPSNPMLDSAYKALTFNDDPASQYESLSFMQVSDGGAVGLIALAEEKTLPAGSSGFEQGVGEDIYSPTGTGDPLNGTGASAGLKKTGAKVGEATGAHVIGLKGTSYWERVATPKPPAFEQGGGMPGHVLFASGGSYMGALTDPSGKITGVVPLGGVLGPGTAVLYPNFSGGINRQTAWAMRLTFRETWTKPSDAVAPTLPPAAPVNPGGPPVPEGSAYMELAPPPP